MKGYKVVAKFGPDTVKFVLPIGYAQDNLTDALQSARRAAQAAFDIRGIMLYPETLKVTVDEFYED